MVLVLWDYSTANTRNMYQLLGYRLYSNKCEYRSLLFIEPREILELFGSGPRRSRENDRCQLDLAQMLATVAGLRSAQSGPITPWIAKYDFG